MRITRLWLHNLRRHEDLNLELARGLTIVRGPNELGKTTLQRAIELGLTRRVTSASADIEGLHTWGAAEDARPVVRIEFEQEEDDAIHTGFVEKAFRGAKGTVRMEYEGQVIGDPALADQVLAELTGVPTEAFFRSTASIRHHEVDDLARDEGALRDRLQASISGADRGTSRARKKLEKALYELNTKGEKNPGRLKVAEAVRGPGGRRGGAGRGGPRPARAGPGPPVPRPGPARARRTRRSRSADRSSRRPARPSASPPSATPRRSGSNGTGRRSRCRRRSSSSRTPTRPRTRCRSCGRSLVRLRAIDMRVRELRAMLSGEVDVKYELETPQPRSWRPTAIVAFVLIIAGAVLAAAGQLGFAALPGGLGIPLALVVGGLVLAIVGRSQRISATSFKRQKQLRDVEIDRRLRGRSQLEQELQEKELELANQLSGLELPDMAAAEALFAAEEAHVAQIQVLSAQLDGLVGREPPEVLPSERDAAALEVEQKTGALEGLGPIAKEPRARERLEVEVQDAERALESARDEEANARALVEQNAVDAEEVAAQAERLALWQEQLATLQRRARVYDLTFKAIDTAERATMRTATRYLEKHMVGDLERVTGGRYRRVRVDDATLGIEVFAPERGDWVDVSALSQGTLDLVYLAARIGLVRLVTGDRRPPLVLDDPFVTLDDERARRALELLRVISADFQVIYLTTSERYDAAADAVRVLDGPTAADREAAGAA